MPLRRLADVGIICVVRIRKDLELLDLFLPNSPVLFLENALQGLVRFRERPCSVVKNQTAAKDNQYSIQFYIIEVESTLPGQYKGATLRVSFYNRREQKQTISPELTTFLV